ncbi:MAG TPA: glycoside hydrolase domain-containing protein [archaeon]|nr:glycoside hydrolase domain-containing protein [archaeon]
MKKLIFILLVVACAPVEKAGLVVWPHPYLKPIEREEACPAVPEKTISLRTTPGEYEPAAFAVRSDKPVSVTVSLEGGKGQTGLHESWCELHRLVSLNDSTRPNRLFEFSGPLELSPGRTEFFWLTVRPPEDARPGTYTSRVLVQAGRETRTLEISCEVLPFRLEENRIIGGAFMWLVDLPPGWYRDMKEHGLDAIQFFTWEWAIRTDVEFDPGDWAWDVSPIKISRQGEQMVLDFTVMDRIMDELTASGMRGPVVISLGNDHHLFYECRIAEEFGIPIDTSKIEDGKMIIAPAVSPRLDRLFAEGLRQLGEHWKSKGYKQELVILLYDEPTERLLERCKNRYDLLKTVLPDTRVYGVVMDRREWAESMLDQMDIIVANGDFEACRDLAEENGKGYWIYSGVRSVHSTRYERGFLPWRVGAQGTFFWMYNYWFYNPDGCVVYRHPDNPNQLVRSTIWEGIREGMDDLRYLATAEMLIGKAPEAKKAPTRQKLESIKNSIEPDDRRSRPPGEARDEAGRLKYYTEATRLRNEVIEIILDLL